MTIDDGGPAFPAEGVHQKTEAGKWERVDRPGMSLRDYFAGQTLKGMMEPACVDVSENDALWIAAGRASYMAANAMLKARKETP